MESPVRGRPNRETGLPPGVEVGPLGKRFVAYLINISVPAVVGFALILLLPTTTGALRVTVGVIGAVVVVGWLVVIWLTLAVRAASPGLRAMKLQLVGFLDGRPIGPTRVFLRAVVFWALYITGIGLLIMLIMMLRHPRKQGWHDLAVTSVMIKKRLLAPPVQPSRAAASAQQAPPAQVGSMSQPQPTDVRAAARPGYAPGQGYAPAGGPVPPGMAPAAYGAPYATAVPPGGSAAPYGGNAYAAPPQGAPYGAVPYGSSPASQASGGEMYSPGQPGGPMSPLSQGSPAGAAPAYEDFGEYAASPGEFADQTPVGSGSPYVQDWSILLDDGRRIAVEGLVLLGRNPQPKAGEEDAQLIKIADETRTVSKSHLAVGVDAGGVYVVDRGSTNGSTVSTTNGMSSRCRAGEMVRVGDGAIVSIGDHWIEITRGS
ncbi:MAG TPA: RDD family protein [Propionibacteriaceae bacterium]|nr:RDD family protein [Propionibacteriaceae bacterium]